MKIIVIESIVKIKLRDEEGVVKVKFEIPYPEGLFSNLTEEDKSDFTDAKEYLKSIGLEVDGDEKAFVAIMQKSYGGLAGQVANFIAATLKNGALNIEILRLLQNYINKAADDAVEIIKMHTKDIEDNS